MLWGFAFVEYLWAQRCWGLDFWRSERFGFVGVGVQGLGFGV